MTPTRAGCAMFFTCSPEPLRWTATKRNTRCTSASSIASITYSRCSAAPHARSARRTSTSASSYPPSPASSSAPGDLPVEDPDFARHRRRLSYQGRRIPDAIEHLQHGPRERDPFHPGTVLQRQPRSDPSLRLETSASLRVSDTVTLRGGMAYTRAVFREGQFAGNDVPLVSHYTGKRRRDLEHLAKLSGV